MKIDNFAVTLLRFIGADFIAIEKCVNDLSCDTVVVRCLQSHYCDLSEPILLLEKMRQKHCLATFQKSPLICEQERKPVPTFFRRSDDRTISEKIGTDLPILKSCDSRTLV